MTDTPQRGGDSELEQYLQEISRYPLLKRPEERELADRIALGDLEARDRMIRSNLRLVVSIAKNYTQRGMNLLDLIEEGNLGLLKAVGRFSPDQGCKFSTYASWWIKQTIRRALVNKVKSVRVPAYMSEMLARWKRTSAELAQKLGREVTAEDVSRALQLAPAKSTIVRQALLASASLSRGGDREEDSEGEDSLAGLPSREPAPGLPDSDREALLHAMEYGLTERERKVIEMRYGLGAEGAATLETIGARIGLTRERIRQIEVQALHKLHLFILHEDLEEEEKRAARHRARHGGAARRAAGESPWAPAPPAGADVPPSGEPPRRRRRQTARLHLKPPGGGPASAGQPGRGEGGE